MKGTRAEFYEIGAEGHLAVVSGCGGVPRQKEFINILGVTYIVVAVDWCVDHADRLDSELRANVLIKKAAPKSG